VAKVGCQDRKQGLHVESLAVPGHKPFYGKGMSQMVESRVPAAELLDIRPADQLPKSPLETEGAEPLSVMVDEKGLAVRIRENEVPHPEVVPKGIQGGGMWRNQAMLVEFGMVDRQGSLSEIQVRVVEADHFPDSQAGAGGQGGSETVSQTRG